MTTDPLVANISQGAPMIGVLLAITFGDQRAVAERSVTATAGKVTGFLGPNGASKTATYRPHG